MSSYYDLSSQFSRSDLKLSKYVSPSISSTPTLSIAPPSYSQVILEKLQTQQQATAIITTWERKLKELQNSVEDAKKQMYQAQEIMQDMQYRCIRLECKNEYLLEHLKQTSELAFSLSDSTHDVNNEKLQTEDSLSRMNVSVENLIEEAQKSLTSHFSLKADSSRLRRTRSNPCFTEINYTENRRKSSHHDHQTNISNSNNGDTVIDLKSKKYQKARYFHSQWKLVITMKQLLESVQHTIEAKQGTKVIQQQQQQEKKVKQASATATLPPPPPSLVEGVTNLEEPAINLEKPTAHIYIHHHHHHHHIHHHLSSDIDTPSFSPSGQPFLQITNENNDNNNNNDSNNDSFLNKIKIQTSITAKNATTSLLQYVGIMPSENKIIPPLQTALVRNSNSNKNNNYNRPVKYRTMFLATIMIMQTFDPSPNHFPRRRLLWTSKGSRIIKRWYQHPSFKKLFPIWLKKAHLVFYMARCFKIK